MSGALAGNGCQVRISVLGTPGLRVVDTLDDACAGAAPTLVVTDWAEFRGIDPVSLAQRVARPTVVHGRLALDPDKWRAAGWDLQALGRGAR